MSPPGEPFRHTGAQGKSIIQDKIATVFYSIGLLCSSYPISVLIGALFVIISCSSPLINIPLPFRSPQQEWTSSANLTKTPSQPFCFVQQVVLKVAVVPWEAGLSRGDAFRAPLYEAFKLLEIVRNFEDTQSGKTLGHVCLHVEAVTKYKDAPNFMPQYNCLVLSPANFWHQDIQEFHEDNSILTTIFSQHKFQKGKVSLAEMLFGMRLRQTGIKRYPLRNRQRIIQYAVTLFFKHFDKEFIEGLKEKLATHYPLHQNRSVPLPDDTLVIQFPEEVDYLEVSPLVIAFVLLFLYYYFYVRKVEEIKSKPGMAFAATVTVICSLSMTMGIGFFFGLGVNNQRGKWIFPYLAILVGLENVLVLTKSVLNTPFNLDAKIRIAQGLSKEGWSTTKNLLLEITVFTFGLFTFVPAIQEFCLFAILCLISGLFLQIFFFLPIISIDITRASNAMEKTGQNFRSALYEPWFLDRSGFQNRGMNRSKSHPSFPTNVVAGQKHGNQDKKLPKRLRLVNIWARTRFFQRSLMVLMVMWISVIAYNSDLINNYMLTAVDDKQSSDKAPNYSSIDINLKPPVTLNYVTYSPWEKDGPTNNRSYDMDKLRPSEYDPWFKLVPGHWSSILKNYNISVSGRSVAILPNIKLSHAVSPEQAVLLRNPEEKYGDKFEWRALAIALDPIDFNGDDSMTNSAHSSEQPIYPQSPMEIFFLIILILISVIVLAYAFILLYKCVCSRNYAEWRASWFPENSEEPVDEQVLLEAVPVVVEGHQQDVECIATDGLNLASACLGGHLKVWDSVTAELICHIDRLSYFLENSPTEESIRDDDDASSDYESGSPPTRGEAFPRLMNRINTDFSGVKPNSNSNEPFNARQEFYKTFKYHYSTHGESAKLKMEARASSGANEENPNKFPSIWCIDYLDNLLVVGCADGRLEFWDVLTNQLKCLFEDGTQSGITHVKIVGTKLIAAHLCGTLDLFQLQTYTQGRPVDWSFSCAYRRTHVRTGSMGSMPERDVQLTSEDLRCNKIASVRAHQQSITCLDCEGGRILTGSQDHTLKVHRLENADILYTLHGHCGPITCLFIDRVCTATSGSGSQDGMLCVWDLLSGACMYSLQAHDGCIISLTYSASYVISLGIDERLCVWERFQGHLLNTILVGQVFTSDIVMLASHLVVTAKNGGLIIWDVRSGECVRTIALGRDPFVFINRLTLLHDAVLCDYGKQLRIVRFPLISHKFD
ncbi:sterol regulatory element-binding protein cleavage-activating protein isoform X2 [Cylas formicarius]|uniref:sterol regulatory element-binding protein cleavage-activating protein isoform X2 n=1 Tax=Cylas formicarius TaxID=197179 RepID=UPI0029586A5D|nr:sterol regulatory element-binding protein cleavage-activating protein isoform X2 [Cylas formicarius]